jgi:hypothetical protein
VNPRARDRYGTTDDEHGSEEAVTEYRTTFAWTVEGYVKAGTITDYAKDRQAAELGDLSISDELWNGSGMVPVEILAEPIGSDGVRRYEVHCAGRVANYSVDHRS